MWEGLWDGNAGWRGWKSNPSRFALLRQLCRQLRRKPASGKNAGSAFFFSHPPVLIRMMADWGIDVFPPPLSACWLWRASASLSLFDFCPTCGVRSANLPPPFSIFPWAVPKFVVCKYPHILPQRPKRTEPVVTQGKLRAIS
jgi:hypothetical protein